MTSPPSDSPTRLEAVPLVEADGRRVGLDRQRDRRVARPRAAGEQRVQQLLPQPVPRRDGTIEIVSSGVCSSTNP